MLYHLFFVLQSQEKGSGSHIFYAHNHTVSTQLLMKFEVRDPRRVFSATKVVARKT